MTALMRYAKMVIKKRGKQRLEAIRSWSFGAAPRVRFAESKAGRMTDYYFLSR